MDAVGILGGIDIPVGQPDAVVHGLVGCCSLIQPQEISCFPVVVVLQIGIAFFGCRIEIEIVIQLPVGDKRIVADHGLAERLCPVEMQFIGTEHVSIPILQATEDIVL